MPAAYRFPEAAGFAVTVPDPLGLTLSVRVKFLGTNVAVTDAFAFIVRQRLESIRVPLHELNVCPDAGVAVRQTFVPAA